MNKDECPFCGCLDKIYDENYNQWFEIIADNITPGEINERNN